MTSDVIIIGGGPAGCSAALTLRRRGLSAEVVAPEARIEKPTEMSSPNLRQILQALGATSSLDACEPCFGICSSWGRTELALHPSIANPYGHSWFIHRKRFDSSLRKLVCEAGVRWTPERAREIAFDRERVSVVTESTTLRARWVIFATGSLSWAARVTGQQVVELDSLVAYWGQLSDELPSRLLFVEPSAEGWWYACPNEGRGAVACLVTDSATARKIGVARNSDWNGLFEKTKLFDRLAFESKAITTRAKTISLAILPRTTGKIWTAIGDSALNLDPLGSFGTMGALESGLRAGEAVADMLGGNTVHVQDYQRWTQSLFNEFARQRCQQYEIENSIHATGFWRERATLPKGNCSTAVNLQ